MDKQQIGLVDYPSFLQVIEISSAKPIQSSGLSDNFDWEQGVIEKLKNWILQKRITLEEAFKSFDCDFDGKISKQDLKKAMIDVLSIPEEEIYQTRLERLFRLMDFYRTGR